MGEVRLVRPDGKNSLIISISNYTAYALGIKPGDLVDVELKRLCSFEKQERSFDKHLGKSDEGEDSGTISHVEGSIHPPSPSPQNTTKIRRLFRK